MKRNIGVYIHIPFCKAKCYYCDFVSFANKEEKIEEYINAVIQEIRKKNLSKYNIETLYIGGGTPSIIESKYITSIINELRPSLSENAEITIEVNPGTVNEEKLRDYKNAGVNRLSIGLQSTNNNLLKEIGRIHTYEEFLKTYETARKVGFGNINVDLMLALPNQTIEILADSIEKVIKLNPEHISVYSLILEENTKLYNMVNTGKVILPSDEIERQMYWLVKNTLEKNGYEHYEISNFAKTGYKSRHNSDCWEQKEYIGIGAAAHSYIDGKRFSNTESIEKYIANIKNSTFEKNITVHEVQTNEEMQKEYMILGLRKIQGININTFKNKFGMNPIFEFRNEINKLVSLDLIEVDGNYIRLTDKGLNLANIVWEEFI